MVAFIAWVVVIALAGLSAAALAAEASSSGVSTLKDSWLTTKTKTRLLADDRVKSTRISVEPEQGVVTLRGKALSA